jgi:OOP family OmpA-OmpF porin
MKKILLILMIVGTTACTSTEFQKNKKVVIRPIYKENIEDEIIKESPKTQLVLRAEANFAFNNSDIRGEDSLKLDKFIEYIRNKPGNITIVGHTDTKGSAEYNRKLSEKRAMAVKMYIEERLGLRIHHIHAEGRGESENLVEEITQLDRAKNRRVEVNFKEENAE